jgi:hypothetical protein
VVSIEHQLFVVKSAEISSEQGFVIRRELIGTEAQFASAMPT